MYSTCIFCHGRLGTNEVVETFPVGRRVAFDPGRGRLWVVGPHCRQWNLAPLEERWETLEALERLFRDTPTRYSTEHIGLARVEEGLDVVRIGEPGRPEYAAWRYGGELLRRRRQTVIGLGTVAVGGAAVLGGAAAGLMAVGVLPLLSLGLNVVNFFQGELRNVAHVELNNGKRAVLKRRHTRRVRVRLDEGGGWRLEFPCRPFVPGSRWSTIRGVAGPASVRYDPVAVLRGDMAVRAAAKILPALNDTGASRRRVRDAARFVEQAAMVDTAFGWAEDGGPSISRMFAELPERTLFRLPAAMRLGLEMATQEAAERRALEEELALLEAEWREAEEIAAIADDLVLPRRVRRFLRRAQHTDEPG
ncbi:MAG: hypothetical protein P8174_10810 [Gemmatimonadota bacterium]